MGNKEYVPAPNGADTEIKIECDCHDGTALVISGWKWDDVDDEYIFEVGHELRPTPIKERIRAIWKIPQGRPYLLSEGILTQEQLFKLRDWLNKEFPRVPVA